MSTFRMVFIKPSPSAEPGTDEYLFTMEESDARAPIALQAATAEAAKVEAAAIWAETPQHRFKDPAGYWVVNAHDQVELCQARVEAETPRAPEDAARVVAFKKAFIAAGGALLPLPDTLEDDEYGHADEQLEGQDDFIPLTSLVIDADRRASIARHPIASDPAQLEKTIAFLASTKSEDGTVGDLQRWWMGAGVGLAQMAEAGLLISAEVSPQEIQRAA